MASQVEYDAMWKLYKEIHSNKPTQTALVAFRKQWKGMKKDLDAVKLKIAQLRAVADKKKKGLDLFWASACVPKPVAEPPPPLPPPPPDDSTPSTTPSVSSEISTLSTAAGSVAGDAESDSVSVVSEAPSETSGWESNRPRPAQEAMQVKIGAIEANIAVFVPLENQGLLAGSQKQDLMAMRKQLKGLKGKLSHAQSVCRSQQKFRDKQAQTRPNKRARSGRPAVEDDFPYLHDAILSIVAPSVAADPKRRSEMLTSCRGLDSLVEELNKRGIPIKRSAAYLRLLPKRSNSIQGKLHVRTVPVRFSRAQNSLMREHPDGHFCNATVKNLKDLACLFGSEAVLYLSQDDKSRVPLGLPAANKQAPILMHLQYKVRLPDHDWVIGEKHKLIPSVYAFCQIKDGSVKHSGNTYICVRSGKHDSSSAQSHAADFHRLVNLPVNAHSALTADGLVKPILTVTVDGGPDENPRYPKTLQAWMAIFKEYNLDAVFVATHAPGQSAFNFVERRMAPLSHQLSGVILPHDTYGQHLNASGKTVNFELEKRNFERAGETLAELWSELVIDDCPVTAHFIPPQSPIPEFETLDEQFLAGHVRQSQYLLQIVRCQNRDCCKAWRTNYLQWFPKRFLQAPKRVTQSVEGAILAPREMAVGEFGSLFQQQMADRLPTPSGFSVTPYDYYCPSVRTDLGKRVCPICGIYHASQSRLHAHKKLHIKKGSLLECLTAPPISEESLAEDAAEERRRSREDAEDALPIYNRNIFDIMQDDMDIEEEEL